MSPLERRLRDLEYDMEADKGPTIDAEAAFDEQLALQGTSREEIIAKYGSIPNYTYCKYMGKDQNGHPLPGRDPALRVKDGRTAQEIMDEYFAMLNPRKVK